MKGLANFFSFLFHPVFIPIYSVFLYFKIDNYQNRILIKDDGFLYVIYSLMIIIGIVFPLISFLIMYKTKVISDLNLSQRKERIPVLIIVLIYYLMVYYMYRTWNESYINLPLPIEHLISFLFGGLVIMILTIIVTLKLKISLHSIAIGGMAGGFLALSIVMNPINNLESLIQLNACLLIIMGIVSSSRLFLKAHVPYEVLTGMILGFGIEYFIVINEIAI